MLDQYAHVIGQRPQPMSIWKPFLLLLKVDMEEKRIE